MRLLRVESSGELSFTADLHDRIPQYATLSHTWGPDTEEVTFQDIIECAGKAKDGYKKIQFCRDQAHRDGLKFFWVDTCCINKSSSNELAEAINSMFRWYRNAAKCYVYLSDVSIGDSDGNDQLVWDSAFRQSRWFTRGWTLQELLAPVSVEFFSRECRLLGDKKSLERQVKEITGIPARALQKGIMSSFTVGERMSWAHNRETGRKEDKAYSLLGILEIYMTLIYGGGEENALRRLRQEIDNSSIGRLDGSPFSNVPRREVTHFVPREDVQKELRDWLQIRPPSKRFVLQGMGGSGKTQLALRCCQMAIESGFVATLWVNASSPSTVAQSYRSILRTISPHSEGANDDEKVILETQTRIKSWYRSWLLVFDNYDNPKAFGGQAIREYIPGQSGHILFTSRHTDTYRLGHSVDLSRMTRDEGVELLLNITSNTDTSEAATSEAAKIVTTLGHLALAIDQAGAYIRAQNLPLNQFISHYKKRKESVLKNIPDEWEYQDPNDPDNWRNLSAFTTWEMSLDLIEGITEEQKKEKVYFLTLASFLDPFQISDIYFRAHSSNDNANWMEFLRTRGKWDSGKLADLLAEFRRLSLIESFQPRESHLSFSIHPLISDWMKFGKNTNTISVFIELTNMLATFLHTYDNNGLRLELKQETISHLNAWAEADENIPQDSYGTIRPSNSKALKFRFKLAGWPSKERGTNVKHTWKSTKLRAASPERGFRGPREVASSIFAEFYSRQGRYGEAERLYGQALAAREEQLGPTHPDTLAAVEGLAIVYGQQGRYGEAERLYRRVLAGHEGQLGPTHPNTLQTFHNLAIVSGQQGRYVDTERLYKRALAGYEEQLGPTHSDTLRSAEGLAGVYGQQGRYGEAERLYRQALAGREEQLGSRHHDTLRTAVGLAIIYWYQGRYGEAEQLYRRALAGREELLGPTHPDTLGAVEGLAIVYGQQGRYGEAERLYGQALTGRKEQLGPTHPDTLQTVHHLATVYAQQGRYGEAERLYRQALAGREEQLGPTHPDTLQTVHHLATVYGEQSR